MIRWYDGHVVAYTSQTHKIRGVIHNMVLSRKNFSVVYAMKQFRQYLLVHKVINQIDNAPLQWLVVCSKDGRVTLPLGNFDIDY